MRKSTTLSGYSDDNRTPIPEPPDKIKTRSKKDRRRWCKGIKGREHKGEWKLSSEIQGHLNTPQGVEREKQFQIERAKAIEEGRRMWRCSYKVLVCSVCGKHLKIQWDKSAS